MIDLLDHLTNAIRKTFTIQVGEGVNNTETAFRIVDNSGTVVFSADGEGALNIAKLNVSSLPTSASGLNSGDIWNDGGTLKIVS